MAYNKTLWNDNVTPLSAQNMNHIEQGIADAHANLDAHAAAADPHPQYATDADVSAHAASTAAGTHGSATGASANTLAHRDANGDLTARVLRSTVAAGTAPLTVASSDMVANLNADMVDGVHGDTLVAPSFNKLPVWSKRTFPQFPAAPKYITTYRGKLYAVCSGTLYSFDPTTGTFTSLGSKAFNAGTATMMACRGKLFIPSANSRTVHVYNIDAGQWAPDITTPKTFYPYIVLASERYGKVLVAPVWSPSVQYRNIYDVVAGTWDSLNLTWPAYQSTRVVPFEHQETGNVYFLSTNSSGDDYINPAEVRMWNPSGDGTSEPTSSGWLFNSSYGNQIAGWWPRKTKYGIGLVCLCKNTTASPALYYIHETTNLLASPAGYLDYHSLAAPSSGAILGLPPYWDSFPSGWGGLCTAADLENGLVYAVHLDGSDKTLWGLV